VLAIRRAAAIAAQQNLVSVFKSFGDKIRRGQNRIETFLGNFPADIILKRV